MEKSTIAILLFPGTNCEADVAHVVNLLGANAKVIYHDETNLDGIDGVIIPGGFAHGDYLRTGAIARFSPIMAEVQKISRKGIPILGICNGFQILCEAKMLPGALQKNVGMKFICADTELEVVSASPITSRLSAGAKVIIPISHFEGNYTCDDQTYGQLVKNKQIVLRYTSNPNGSRDSIAGVCNERRNVVGLMPHPERACEDVIGSRDGLEMVKSFLDAVVSAKMALPA